MADNITGRDYEVVFHAVVNGVELKRIHPKDQPNETIRWDVAVTLERIPFEFNGYKTKLKLDSYEPWDPSATTFTFDLQTAVVTVSGDEDLARRAKTLQPGDRITIHGTISKAAVWPGTPPGLWILLSDPAVVWPTTTAPATGEGSRPTQPATTREEAARRTLLARAQSVPRIGVYMVTNTNDTRLAEKAALDSLELAKDPALQDDDFVSYDGNSRTLTVSPEGARRFPRGTSVWGTPYVVAVEGRRWFLGTYMPMGSSYRPSVPVAEDDVASDGIGARALRLKTPNPDDVADAAFRARIAAALKAVGRTPATLPAAP
jgi:hypothetical protein